MPMPRTASCPQLVQDQDARGSWLEETAVAFLMFAFCLGDGKNRVCLILWGMWRAVCRLLQVFSVGLLW